jgi:uncharacterized protein (TIGR03435 family)
MRLRCSSAVLLGLVVSAAVSCEAAESPRFEVASIKAIDPNVRHMVGVKVYPGGRVILEGLSLKNLAMVAFRLSYWQVSGGDAWVETEAYNIEAKPTESARSSIKTLRYTNYGIDDERLREMLQSLLADRFRLKFHRETRTGDVYTLERNGKRLRLSSTKAPETRADAPPESSGFGSIGFVEGRWSLFNTSMKQLAKYASDNILRAPVLDRTDLTRAFDYRQASRLSASEANYRDPSDSFYAFLSELGLKFQRGKGPVEILVIDHAERPGAN